MARVPPPVPIASTPPSIAVSVDGRIAEDKLCVDCGYNLRGLSTDGRCPECGADVEASLRGHELQAASLPWLREICQGFALMKRAVLIALCALLFAIAVELIFAYVKPNAPLIYKSADILFGVVVIAMGLLALFGFFLATKVEPRVAARGEGISARRWARFLATSTLALLLSLRLIIYLATGSGWTDYFVIWAPLVIAVTAPLAAAAFVRHATALLERAGSERVLKSAKEARQMTDLAIVLAAIALLGRALGPVLRNVGQNLSGFEKMTSIAGDCNACVMLLLAIGLLELVWRMARTMNETLAAAEAAATALSSPAALPVSPPAAE